MKLTVTKKDELLKYLIENTDIPRKKLKSYLTHGSIYVNDNRITKYNYIVNCNDCIYIDKDKKSNLDFDIIYEDNNIIVVDKPTNLLTISTEKEKEKTLYHILREYVKSINKNNKIFIVHRLDKDTSGVILFAKNEKIKKELQDNWNNYVKLREYTAIIHGIPNKKKDKIINYLNESKTHLVYTSNTGEKAITNYSVIKEYNNYSEVLVDIPTGKRNQIRVAFKSINHPILGDKEYGIKDNANRLYLHATKLKLYYPIIKKEIMFESKVPKEFKKVVNNYDTRQKN